MKHLNRSTEKAKKTFAVKTASADIAAYACVRVTTAGKAITADDTSELNATVYGIAEKAIATDAVGEVTTGGEIYNPSWTWTIDGTNGNLLWMDSTGLLTETIPAVKGRFSVPIAQVLSATNIVLLPQPFNVTEIL